MLFGNDLVAWETLKAVIARVLGKNRDNDFKVLVKKMLQSFQVIGVSMTLKLHFLNNHLEEFANQLPTESDEQGERFHQIIMPMEKRFKGKKLDAMLAEVCWWSQQISSYEDKDTEEDERMDMQTHISSDEED